MNSGYTGGPSAWLPSWFKQTFPVLITLLFLALVVTQFQNVADKAKNVDPKQTINITAEGKITASPDLATINASVVTDGSTAVDAQGENTKKMNKVIDFVKTQGVDGKDIKTQDYSVYPKYDYTNGQSILSGYTASQTLNIKLHDLSLVGKLLDGLTKNGINQIQNVSYSFEHPDDLRQQAREQALSNAKDKATKLTNAAGVKLGKLVSFSENSYGGVVPMYNDMMVKTEANMSGMGGGGSPIPAQVEPGVQDITAQVSVTFELK